MDQDNIWPLVFYTMAVLIVVAGMIGLPYVLGERYWQNPTRRGQWGTNAPYESGIIPTGTARLRLPIQYYLAAMFFVIFDLEAVFIYAWAHRGQITQVMPVGVRPHCHGDSQIDTANGGGGEGIIQWGSYAPG
jgi:NADH:ubiquinone oxidoreductase subunit 3 (subunit A)